MAKFLVIVVRRYNEKELWPLLKVIVNRGHEYDVVSTSTVIREEKSKKPNSLAKTLDDIKSFKGYDALAIASGNHVDTVAFWDDSRVQQLTKQAHKQNAVMGAICVAVPALGRALNGVKVSAYPLQQVVFKLADLGAVLQTTSLTTDKNVVTGENQAMASMWATNMCDLLEGKELTYVLNPSPFERRLTPRKPIRELEHLKEIIERTGKDEL